MSATARRPPRKTAAAPAAQPRALEDLPAFELDSLAAIFPTESQAGRDVRTELTEGQRFRRRSTKRQMLHLLDVANAAKELGSLPRLGETLHVVMRGNFNAWDLVPAVLQLAAPATIARLSVATLGFNKSNAQELVELFDAGQVAAVDFIVSTYFKSTSANEFDFLYQQLTARKQRCVAVRSHAKILLFEMTDGAAYVIESSANLRSCNAIEQFTMTHDAKLLAFHRRWMHTIIGRALSVEAKPKKHAVPR